MFIRAVRCRDDRANPEHTVLKPIRVMHQAAEISEPISSDALFMRKS